MFSNGAIRDKIWRRTTTGWDQYKHAIARCYYGWIYGMTKKLLRNRCTSLAPRLRCLTCNGPCAWPVVKSELNYTIFSYLIGCHSSAFFRYYNKTLCKLLTRLLNPCLTENTRDMDLNGNTFRPFVNMDKYLFLSSCCQLWPYKRFLVL